VEARGCEGGGGDTGGVWGVSGEPVMDQLPCTSCFEKPAEDGATLCIACDRDEWKEATIRGNKRFQDAERLLKEIHNRAGRYLLKTGAVTSYPANHEELIEALDAALAKAQGRECGAC
jgi:hypothetical protein